MKKELSKADHFSLVMGLLGVLTFLFMWKANRELVDRLIQNESYVDILSGSFWLTASLICIYRIKIGSQTNKFLLYFWAVFSFLCCGEELKWGYRLFNYSIPALQEINAQHDISFHNLDIFYKWRIFKAQNLFYLGFFTYFLVVPLLTLSENIKPLINMLKDKLNYITPGIYFLSATWLTILLSCLIPYVFTPRTPLAEHYWMVGVMAENREMFCAFVVLSYVYFYLPADIKN